MKTKVFLLVPGYFVTAESLPEAYRKMRGLSGRSVADLRKQEYFALEFSKDTQIRVNEVDGSWWASKKPRRVLATNRLSKARVAELESKCEVDHELDPH